MTQITHLNGFTRLFNPEKEGINQQGIANSIKQLSDPILDALNHTIAERHGTSGLDDYDWHYVEIHANTTLFDRFCDYATRLTHEDLSDGFERRNLLECLDDERLINWVINDMLDSNWFTKDMLEDLILGSSILKYSEEEWWNLERAETYIKGQGYMSFNHNDQTHVFRLEDHNCDSMF